MKLMTYNILNGGENGLDLVEKVIKSEAPDFLTINEANTFDEDVLENFSKATGLPHYKISFCGDGDKYHVAVFSKLPFKKVVEIKPLMRAGILTLLDTPLGEISIVGTHLTPYTEDLRLPEIDLIAKAQKPYGKKVLMGDMNSLSKVDGYDESMVKNFNEIQIKKFTGDGKLRFDAINKIYSHGYKDPAVITKQNEALASLRSGYLLRSLRRERNPAEAENSSLSSTALRPRFSAKADKIYTAPTSINEQEVHSNMRLDYIFVSENLTQNIKDYRVVKNEWTEKASDHYPVTLTLG